MTWGNFGIVHIISLLIVALMNALVYFILKNKSNKVKIIVLFILSLSGIYAIIFNLVRWKSPLEYLPFHLCSLTAIVLPIAVLTRNKVLNNLLLLWSLGALMALVMNNAQANYEIFSATFFIYYFPHAFEFGIPILMILLKLTNKDYKCIASTVAITLVAYTIIHFINIAINNYCYINNVVDPSGNIIVVNYMYSLMPPIPILEIFWNIIPHSYWYLLLVFPVIVIYLVVLYIPEFAKTYKTKKAL